MARTYYRDSKGRFAKRPGGGGGSNGRSALAKGSSPKATRAAATPKPSTGTRIQTIGGGTISREEAARIMFGSAGAAKKRRKRR